MLSLCLSVCPSVRPSVCHKTALYHNGYKRRITQITPYAYARQGAAPNITQIYFLFRPISRFRLQVGIPNHLGELMGVEIFDQGVLWPRFSRNSLVGFRNFFRPLTHTPAEPMLPKYFFPESVKWFYCFKCRYRPTLYGDLQYSELTVLRKFQLFYSGS